MKKMILDLDTGVDDALAMSYALGSPEVKLIGITGTYGNVLVEQGVRNALAVTDLLGHPEVKVYQGLPHSSTTDHFEVLPISAFIHGDNGIGDVDIPDSNRSVETESAVDFIIDAVKTYGKDLVYVPTGPMTNIEAALKKAPEIKDEIGQIVLMGGALTVPGNCNACMEANISQDPEAADYLFRSGAPTTMIGLDVTLQTLLTYKETQQWRDLGTKAGRLLADMTDFYIKAYETTSPHLGGCGLHDPLAVGVAVDPTLVTTLDINMKVDVEGPTRGRTIGDETRLNDPVKTMKVAVGVVVGADRAEHLHGGADTGGRRGLVAGFAAGQQLQRTAGDGLARPGQSLCGDGVIRIHRADYGHCAVDAVQCRENFSRAHLCLP